MVFLGIDDNEQTKNQCKINVHYHVDDNATSGKLPF